MLLAQQALEEDLTIYDRKINPTRKRSWQIYALLKSAEFNVTWRHRSSVEILILTSGAFGIKQRVA
jgi:hypothetical protein